MVDCTIHLISLHAKASHSDFLGRVASKTSILIKGKPHGWVHKPHSPNSKQLVDHDWDLLLLTTPSDHKLPLVANDLASAHISVSVSVPEAQYAQLKARIGSKPVPSPDTPDLPAEWSNSAIPSSTIVETLSGPLGPGELRLDDGMAKFLSSAIPQQVVNEPACFFNFFKYPKGDRSVHDAYMQGFKDNFGSAAGASVLFMGTVEGKLSYESANEGKNEEGERWDDANLVQYDSVWHYAYMLSTDVYKQLNKQKVEGLEDTCILLVSEVELFDGK